MIYAVNKRTKEHRLETARTGWYAREWDLVGADPDGWIEWHGGECPLPDKHPVELRFRTGDTTRSRVSGPWAWSHDGNALPIIAYRPILDAKPEPPAWDGEGKRPPVGARCMRGHERVLIIAYTDVGSPVGPAVVYQSLDDPGDIDWAVSSVFSPIRNAEDRAVEEMVRVVVDETGNEYSDVETASRILFRAGYRKVDS